MGGQGSIDWGSSHISSMTGIEREPQANRKSLFLQVSFCASSKIDKSYPCVGLKGTNRRLSRMVLLLGLLSLLLLFIPVVLKILKCQSSGTVNRKASRSWVLVNLNLKSCLLEKNK